MAGACLSSCHFVDHRVAAALGAAHVRCDLVRRHDGRRD
jgi:hypothetical protein